MHPVRTTAFSLIELLVTLAIISLLIAISSSAVGAARKQARSGSCASNLRQVGALIHSFAASNRDCPAPADRLRDYNWRSDPVTGWDITTGRALGVLGGEKSVWVCPEMNSSYLGNVRALGVDDRPYGGQLHEVSRSRWTATSQLVLAYDLQADHREPGHRYAAIVDASTADLSDEWYGWTDAPAQILYLPYLGPHSEKYGILYADGHAVVKTVASRTEALLWSGPRWWSADFRRTPLNTP